MPEAPLLIMDGIVKSYPGVKAVKKGRLELLPGEVHSLIGENGAGKSTLIKILSGAVRQDAGIIKVGGMQWDIATPQEAFNLGISVIYQEFNLVPGLTAAQNIFLGKERKRFGFISHAEEKENAKRLIDEIGFNIKPDSICASLSVAEQQALEIAKSLAADARIIAMDEPTSALTPADVDRLFRVIESLRRKKIGIIYITHRLDEVFTISDRVTIMRDGEWVGTFKIPEISRSKMIELMVGRPMEKEYPARKIKTGEERLVVKELKRYSDSHPFSFSVKRGEVLGITGLVGSGKTEIARMIFGSDPNFSGKILLDGKELSIRSPIDAINAGICLLTEDRKKEGLVLGMTAMENVSLPNLRKRLSRGIFVDGKRETERFEVQRKNLKIKIYGPGQIARTLSGGNQQKIVLAKWLESESQVIVFDEPTRGIDVGARFEIYGLINDLAAEGKSIVLISSDFSEILGMSDRIIVMSEGAKSGEIKKVKSSSMKDLMTLSVGNQGQRKGRKRKVTEK